MGADTLVSLVLLVVRTNAPVAEMEELASQGRMPVINAMSDSEHPSQAIADLVTIKEVLGRTSDVHVLYLGEGNNTASALAYAVAQTPGMRLTLATPEGYGLARADLAAARWPPGMARSSRSSTTRTTCRAVSMSCTRRAGRPWAWPSRIRVGRTSSSPTA